MDFFLVIDAGARPMPAQQSGIAQRRAVALTIRSTPRVKDKTLS
jgi:hypothetical protein